MDKLNVVLALLGALNKVVAAKQDDGRIDAGEVVEIVLSTVGTVLGVNPGKLATWIKATEDLIGEGILSKRMSLQGK